MKVTELAQQWEKNASGQLSPSAYPLRLSIEDAAKLEALSEMYPKRATEQLLSDLVAAALAELEMSMPYKKGERIIGRDEMGDPMFEDIGPTPRFLALARKHLSQFKHASPQV